MKIIIPLQFNRLLVSICQYSTTALVLAIDGVVHAKLWNMAQKYFHTQGQEHLIWTQKHICRKTRAVSP